MNLLDLIPAFATIAAILARLEASTISRNKRYKNAISAIAVATNATQAYLVNSDNGRNVDRDREHTLSSLWFKASVDVSKFNPDLAQSCDIKAQYWLEPSVWRKKDIAAAQIRLKEIIKEADRLKNA
jgi:hypothetical protein